MVSGQSAQPIQVSGPIVMVDFHFSDQGPLLPTLHPFCYIQSTHPQVLQHSAAILTHAMPLSSLQEYAQTNQHAPGRYNNTERSTKERRESIRYIEERIRTQVRKVQLLYLRRIHNRPMVADYTSLRESLSNTSAAKDEEGKWWARILNVLPTIFLGADRYMGQKMFVIIVVFNIVSHPSILTMACNHKWKK